ncbi:MAG: hypothetical protein WB471_08970 [Nocardioides sp.]
MSIRTHRWGALGAAGALVLAGVLSGCGVSTQQLRPGVAAQVGATEVSLDDIDEAITDACAFFAEEDQPGFPKALARQQFVSILVTRAAASQALDEGGLELGPDYQQAVGGLDAANSQVPEERRAPFILLNEAAVFVDAASRVIGEAAYAAEGDVPADPAIVGERGLGEITDWLETNDVEINPVFRLRILDGQVVSEAGGTSVAASEFATLNLLDPLTATQEQVTASVEQLPPSQVCGASAAG